MMEVVVTTVAVRRAKLQSNRHHQQTNIQFTENILFQKISHSYFYHLLFMLTVLIFLPINASEMIST